MDDRTWEASEVRRTPVAVTFPDGRRLVFPSDIDTPRRMRYERDLGGVNLAAPTIRFDRVVSLIRALVPTDDIEAKWWEEHDGQPPGSYTTAEDIFDGRVVLTQTETREVASFLWLAYITGHTPESWQEMRVKMAELSASADEEADDDDPPV